jgi:hypothetical protein
MYCRTDGFVSRPESYNEDQQRKVLLAMSRVGRDIWEIFQDLKHPVRESIDALLKSSGRAMQPVTILTNDFSIPWFWLNEKIDDPFLCEVCSLGMQHFSSAGGTGDAPGSGLGEGTYDALLINGYPDLPFGRRELDTVKTLLEEEGGRAKYVFRTHYADTSKQIKILRDEDDENQRRTDFPIVHFCGKYSKDTLWLKGGPLSKNVLKDVLNRSLLVLDGYRSECGVSTWPDLVNFTSDLVNGGKALGCVVPVFPVKNDPIAARILWGSFYPDLRRGAITVGQALANARFALKTQFENNPVWAAYQLIGSPIGQLAADDDEET